MAVKHVQPSAKREGFATIPDVSWDVSRNLTCAVSRWRPMPMPMPMLGRPITCSARACARACRAFTCGDRCVPCDLFAFAFAWLQDIGALEAVRAEIEGAVLEPIRRPERFEALGLAAPAGVLLYAVPCNATPMPCNAMPCRAVPCEGVHFL